ncbi:hypothetical protein AUR67_17105 [Pseudoalteromonas sp. XI10]|uniref:hypothetical protein n=1 Tax=Pseudoalteromonas sp. XI10 TaxID=1766621 RepID=UPI0007335378|nr:hypothetical protein [Pseudoalteromonas sp. XI10]KTG18874.1 hypothetical protein AUR67_17105 [Pseudoalteromonas sp. XI10]
MAINSLANALTISNADTASSNTSSKVGYKLSNQEMNKLSGREVEPAQKEEVSSELPAHIRKMVEQLEKLKEQLELAKEQLAKLQALKNQEDEAVKVQVETQTKMVMEIQTQIMSLSQSISDALKEAGISDPGVLMNVLV